MSLLRPLGNRADAIGSFYFPGKEDKKQNMAQLRTLPKAYDAFKARDPETALTKNYFRTLVKTGAIPSVRLGKTYLIDIETVDQYIAQAFSGLR